ncbi:MAG: hypothetical protein J0L93_11300 [Deltaproteobacteria bacterium]|nr:hypothetical protein [Deltaproteobacteria bacterium]
MANNVFALDKFYQTLPPQQIAEVKVPSVLEYLAFSGGSIYLTIESATGKKIKIEKPSIVLDVFENDFLIELPEFKSKIDLPAQVYGAFGYKRKRAEFTAKIESVDGAQIRLAQPKHLTLHNLRRNPRLQIDKELIKKSLEVRIVGQTSIGKVDLKKAEIFEMSQLGISLFLDRTQGLLLPGDKIESLEISLEGRPVLKTSGVVSRVDMQRTSPSMPQSYEIVMLFRQPVIDDSQKPKQINRSAKRIPILDSRPCFFSAEHPFFPGRKIEGQAFEISGSGLSCMLEKTTFPIIRGMRFKNCQLQLPHCPPRDFVFEVAHVDFRSDGEVNQFKLGGEFISASVELIKDISNYAQKTSGGFVQDVTEEDFDLLWEFMFETNFVYQNKRKQIQNKSKEILETYHRLLSTDNPIIKKLIFKENQEIKGHVSAVRFYDHAWIIQHLNALKASGTSAAQEVVMGIVNFFYDVRANNNTETFYVMSFYRPDNLYPAILFGESCKRINDPLKSTTYDFGFGSYKPIEDLKNPLAEKVSVDEPDSFIKLSDHLIRQNKIPFMRAVGLGTTTSPELKISKSYDGVQLHRERHLLSLSAEDNTVFGLVETSSAGLNLSELTNSIYLFSEGQNPEILRALTEAVLAKAYEAFFAPQNLQMVVLQPAHQERTSTVEWSKVYTCWITTGAAVGDFEKAAATVMQDFKSLVVNARSIQSEEKQKA